MMNWNQNDTKYILKRLILYFIIACIVFFAGHSCAKASVQSTFIDNYYTQWTVAGTTNNYKNFTQTSEYFKQNIEGYLVINMTTNVIGINEVRIMNSSNQFQCQIGGSFTSWNDSTTQILNYSLICPVQFTTNTGLKTIRVEHDPLTTNRTYTIHISPLVTLVSTSGEASQIVAAQQAAAGQTIQAILDQSSTQHADAQAIQSAINTATQNEISAINNQTQAINDQTDWFDQDYSSIIDTEFLDVFDDLFDNDDDVVRQFILIPLNFFVLIYNACSSNSCSPIVLGELYGTTLSIPCINWSSLLGTAVTNTIDIIFAGCLVFGMIRMIKKMINKIMTLSSTITDECGVEVFK